MAKHEPTLTLVGMETKLGYKISDSNYPDDCVQRFFCDLRPVLDSIYERTKKELEHERQRFLKDNPVEKDVLGISGVHVTIAALPRLVKLKYS